MPDTDPLIEYDVLIVGAGHAGTQVANELIGGGYPGSIGILSAELHEPYERPPLTKGFLQGKTAEVELSLFVGGPGVSLHLGQQALGVDAVRRLVRTHDREFRYGTLVWATGGEARRLGVSGEELAGVHALRTLDDARYAREAMRPGTAYAIIGGGFIGLESAAAFVAAGVDVTVLEAADRLLARVTSPDVSEFFLAEHRRAGVRIDLSARILGIEGADGRVTGVALGSGEVLPADRVLVGIGIVPNVAPLLDAGAAGGNGVEVDEHGATSLAGIYAVGDCSSFPFTQPPLQRLRLESIQNASEQAKSVAAAILGRPLPYRPVPWFWSNQYDIKFKTVGISSGYDEAVVRGNPAQRRFSVMYLRNGRALAVDSINSMKDYVDARSIVGRLLDRARLADPEARLADAVIPERVSM